MYQPDRLFMKDLKALDKRLNCYFEDNHGHFVVTYQRAIGDPVPIMMVEGKNGAFRQPDQREINKLHEYDIHRESMKEKLQRSAKYMEDARRKTKKTAASNIRDMTKDGKIQLANAFARLTGGKHNSTFRRINLKPKGKVFRQSNLR